MISTVSPKLLVLGGPSSGKTTYRAQLSQRIEHKPGELTLLKSVGDRSAIDGEVERLLQGLQPMHTHSDTYHSTSFGVVDRSGRQFVLEFADYGGEQVRRMANSNAVPTAWVDRAKGSDFWLLFLRIDNIRSTKSFMTDPVATDPQPAASVESLSAEASTEMGAIETLQRLLFVRGAALQFPIAAPRLAIALSCWDELPEPERTLRPADLLQQRAPLLAHFLKANWQPEHLQTWGLSSTEEPLPETIPNEEFIRKGAEHVGFIVQANGKRSPDLTIPIAWLLAPR
jgi:hypothetical protein